jgi:hypothetical protein
MSSSAMTKAPRLWLLSLSARCRISSFAHCQWFLYGTCRSRRGRRLRFAGSLVWACCKYHIAESVFRKELMEVRTCICGVLRAYYAISVYYSTYDITWYAWYGWVWTALEAQLAVICACAPALKGFFKRYFSVNSTRSGAYGYGTGQPSSSGRVPGYGKLSPGNSLATTSNAEGGRWESEPVPLNRIKVSTTTNIIEDRDESASIASTESTSNLTALPFTTLPLPAHHNERGSTPSIWNGNRTVITAYRQDDEIDDIEKHPRDV